MIHKENRATTVQTSLQKKPNWFQTIGEIMITPASALPLAGLLMMAGDILNRAGIMGSGVLVQTGSILLTQFPLLIAISLAYGLAKGQPGAAALTGALSYLVLVQSGSAIYRYMIGTPALPGFSMGISAGVLAGLLAVFLHNRLRLVKLPEWLAFFNGCRASGIAAIVVSLFVGAGCGALWFLLRVLLIKLAAFLVLYGAGGAFIYGFLSRLLMPFGLQTVLNQEIWHNFGNFTSQAGQLVTGDLDRFLAGDPTAGKYIAGFFPMMIFGVPAIAASFSLTARLRSRYRIILLMVVVGLVSLVSGVTEPIEYLILFGSPLLYLLYSLLYGVSMLLGFQLQILDGFSFSTGLTDYIVYWQQATNPDVIWQLGILMAVLSFATTYFMVTLLKIRAPGRDRPEAIDEPEEIAGLAKTEETADAEPEQIDDAQEIVEITEDEWKADE